jgi:hypothetical protein
MHTPIGQSHVVKQAVAIPVLPKVAVAEYNGISRQRRYVGTAIFFVNRPRETYSWRVEESGKCGNHGGVGRGCGVGRGLGVTLGAGVDDGVGVGVGVAVELGVGVGVGVDVEMSSQVSLKYTLLSS